MTNNKKSEAKIVKLWPAKMVEAAYHILLKALEVKQEGKNFRNNAKTKSNG